MIDYSLNTSRGCLIRLNALQETPPKEIGRTDIALLNLLCAVQLPGSESLNIPACLATLDQLAAVVRQVTQRNLHRQRNDPDYGHSEPMWRMSSLITTVKRDFGASYSPQAAADLAAGVRAPFSDASEVFLHGLLNPDRTGRWGTCTSIPVLVAAVARRLGYPVGLAVTRRHVYARWDNGGGTQFNIEASNPMGMTSKPDEYYRNWPEKLTPEEENGGFYLRSLHPAEEFALFMRDRAYCLMDAARYDETFLWCARALQFAPDDPHFAQDALMMADHGIKYRHWRKYPEQKIPKIELPFSTLIGNLLPREERSLFLTIVGHHHESLGQLSEAQESFEDACRQNFHGNNEHCDLQRFLCKHGRPRKVAKYSLSENNQKLRRFQLNCKPHEQRGTLRRLADQFEHNGEMVKARDALHDLYLFDPADTELFQRARAIEQQAMFQVQYKALRDEKRRALQSHKRHRPARIAMPRGAIISGKLLTNEKE